MAQRTFLLNEQISLEARRIAHQATSTCHNELSPNHNDDHTAACNTLKCQIEELALQVKLATTQPPLRRRQDPAMGQAVGAS